MNSTLNKQPLSQVALSLPAKLSLCALFIQGWLVLLHLRLTHHDSPNVRVMGQAFDLTAESSLPNALSSMLALAVAVVAGLIASRYRRVPEIKGRVWVGWLLMMATFLIMAIDDSAGLHERLNAVVSLDITQVVGYPSHPWHIFSVPVLAAMVFTSLGLLHRQFPTDVPGRVAVVLGLLSYAAAYALDFAEGWEIMTKAADQPLSQTAHQWMFAEEIIEMFGITFFFYATLRHYLFVSAKHETPQEEF